MTQSLKNILSKCKFEINKRRFLINKIKISVREIALKHDYYSRFFRIWHVMVKIIFKKLETFYILGSYNKNSEMGVTFRRLVGRKFELL